MMLKQYAYFHGYKPIGTTIIEKTFLNKGDYETVLEDMRKSNCNFLLIENISIFCRNEIDQESFVSFFEQNGCKLHSLCNGKLYS